MHYVYEITGPNGAYIGKTSRPVRKRHREHFEASRLGTTSTNKILTASLAKYGAKNFVLSVICSALTEADAFACERAIIQQRRTDGIRLFNFTSGGEGSVGMKLSEESRRKMSASRMGHHVAETTRQRISRANRGRKLTDAHKAKLSQAKKGKVGTRLGQSPSPETRMKISNTLRNKRRKTLGEPS